MDRPSVQESENIAYSTAVESEKVAKLIADLGVSGEDDNTSTQLTQTMVSLVGKVQDIYNLPKVKTPDEVKSEAAIQKIFDDNLKMLQEIYSGKIEKPVENDLLERYFYSS